MTAKDMYREALNHERLRKGLADLLFDDRRVGGPESKLNRELAGSAHLWAVHVADTLWPHNSGVYVSGRAIAVLAVLALASKR